MDNNNNLVPEDEEKSNLPRILGISISLIIIILLTGGLTYAFSTNIIKLPFTTSSEVIEPSIAATANTDGSSTVTINNPNNFGTVFYTIDGSDPLTNSLKYETPLTIKSTTALKARVIDEKNNLSEITSQQFTIVEKVVEKPVETTTPQTPTETIIPAEYQGTWESIKAVGIYNFTGNSYTFSYNGNVQSGTIGRVEPFGSSSTVLVFYPVEVNHGFTVDPGEKGDGKITIDGTTYVSEDVAASYFD